MNNMYSYTPMSGAQNWYNPMSIQSNAYEGTNVYKVTSLEEAIMKSNSRPSETVYFNQSKNEFYNVRIDVNGNKTWQTFVYNVLNSTDDFQISKSDFDALVARVAKLEGVGIVQKEDTNNV